MIVSIPESSKGRPLTESIRPTRWEHLSGPFTWFKWADPTNVQVEDHTEYGAIVRIQAIGKIGAIAEHISEYGTSPYPNVLLSGPGGAGKSVFTELLARSVLSAKRLPVTYETPDGEIVTLINDKTGKPFKLNPEDKGRSAVASVRKALSTPQLSMREALASNSAVQFFNAGPIGKPETDEISASIRGYAALPGAKGRVIVISEFDNLEKRQVPSFKVALDTKDMPPGILVVCDTNHLDQVKHSMGPAGMERFEVIPISSWALSELLVYAKTYIEHFNIEFVASTFVHPENASQKLDAAELIAERAAGSMRSLLKILQTLVSYKREIDYDELVTIMSEDDTSLDEASGAAWQFINIIQTTSNPTPGNIINFAKQQAYKKTAPAPFINAFMRYILDRHPSILIDEEANAAVMKLVDIAQQQNAFIPDALWVACINPLMLIATAMKNKPERKTRERYHNIGRGR